MGPPDSDRISRVPPYSGYCYASSKFRVRDCHSLWSFFPKRSSILISCNHAVLQPPIMPKHHWFGLFPVRSPLLRESLLFSFPTGTKMFSVPRVSLPHSRDDRPSTCRVVSFGNLRIKGHLHLPEAYRSLSRPSSPVRA